MPVAADALQEPCHAAEWMDEDHAINGADVDSEFEAGAADDDPQPAVLQAPLDRAPPHRRDCRMVDADGMRALRIAPPQRPGQPLGQVARVREDERGPVGLQLRHQALQRLAEHLGGRVAEQGCGRRVEPHDTPVFVQGDHGLPRRVGDCGRAKLALLPRRGLDVDE